MRLRATRRGAVAMPRAASPWALDLDFTSGVLDPRVTFSRSSPAWYFNSAGVLVQAAANAPRFAFDPVTPAPPSLQIEAEARTNLVTHSSDLTASSWITGGGSGTTTMSNVSEVVNPDGSSSLQSLFTATSAAYSRTAHGSAVPLATGSNSVGSSIFVRYKSGNAVCRIFLRNGTSGTTVAELTFNCQTGAVVSNIAGTFVLQALPNGWFRAQIVGTPTGGSSLWFCGGAYDGSPWTGQIYVWGAQQEVGSSVSSYIPTFGAAVTRAADVCTMTGANFSNWYAGATECTLFSHSMLTREPGALTYPSPFRLLSADLLSRISLYFTGTAVNAVGEVVTAGTFQGGSSIPAPINSFYKVAERAATNNLRAASNGALGALDATVVYPNNLVRAELGSSGFMGFIKAVGVATRGMTDAELQAITA